ncbi:MAG: muramoyltetrapeptide carboxypeptidase [Desulfobacteraceae bacterium Eth-SRB1]|nr:MAG: muramoyltetrapeptide carboxypeptidase [Desulfobacteraceae bacterium Eth-SRB1]
MKVKKTKPVIPARLRQGDTIGIVAPASHFNMEKFNRGIAVLESMGFRILIPDRLFNKKGYLAGSDLHRAGLINKYFADTTIKAIICARGGFGSIRTLSLLDYESIKMNPKIFVGFSDISALLSSLYSMCGFVTFHGPTVTTLGDAGNKTKDSLFSMLMSERKIEIALENGFTIRQGSAFGQVSGGNLTTLSHLTGTEFQPDFKDCIMFLEDKGEASYRIDRMLSHMKLAGCFDGLAGLILGSFEDCGNENEIFKIVGNIFDDGTIPILAGFEIGHGKNNITIPIGLNATIDTDRQLLSFYEPATTNKHRA